MIKRIKFFSSIFVLVGLLNIVVSAQSTARGNVAILLDFSGSMNAQLDGKTRRDIAVESLRESVNELDGNAAVALYAFGTNFDNTTASKAQSCEDILKLVDYSKGNAGEIKEVLVGLQAKGWTPLAKAIQTIGNDLSKFGDSEHNLIILSDGEESCGGDPVKAVEQLKANGVNVIVNVIGLDVDAAARRQLEAVASAGGGEYFSASDSGSLSRSLATVVNKVELEEQFKADFSGDGVFKMGGSSFEDAVQLTMADINPDLTMSLPKNLIQAFLTYRLPKELQPGDVLTIGNIFGPYIDISSDGSVFEDNRDTWVDIIIFNKRKGAILERRNDGGVNQSAQVEIVLTEELLDNSYLFIGSKNFNVGSKTKIFFEVKKGSDNQSTSGQQATGLEGLEGLAGLFGGANGEAPDLSGLEALIGGFGGSNGSADLSGLAGLLGGLGGENVDLSALGNLFGGNAGGEQGLDLLSLFGGPEARKEIEKNKAELSKTPEGRAALQALGIKPTTSFLDKTTFGVNNKYLLGGGVGLIALVMIAGVAVNARKKQ